MVSNVGIWESITENKILLEIQNQNDSQNKNGKDGRDSKDSKFVVSSLKYALIAYLCLQKFVMSTNEWK